MVHRKWTTVPLAVLALLSGCGPSYSPDTYSPNAVQQANKAERGEVIGVRPIGVSAAGLVGAATGAAAGGVAGAQAPGGVGSAFGAIGGGLIGGLVGNSVEHATGDTKAFEYIVRKTNNELVSVTQRDTEPLKIGTKVLVISGNQARIVADYTVNPEAAASQAAPPAPPPPAAATTTEPHPVPVAASPLPAPAVTAGPTPLAPPSPAPAPPPPADPMLP